METKLLFCNCWLSKLKRKNRTLHQLDIYKRLDIRFGLHVVFRQPTSLFPRNLSHLYVISELKLLYFDKGEYKILVLTPKAFWNSNVNQNFLFCTIISTVHRNHSFKNTTVGKTGTKQFYHDAENLRKFVLHESRHLARPRPFKKCILERGKVYF